MSIAERNTYLLDVADALRKHWPENRTINVVCHGHSVPSGYFATPMVDTFNAYPYLLHRGLKERFPFAVINVVVTAVGGEQSEDGARRFADDVLCHKPDVLTIDYGLNDRSIGRERAEAAWRFMINKATDSNIKSILLTPTHDISCGLNRQGNESWNALCEHASLIRDLADEYQVGLVDSFAAFNKYAEHGSLLDLLSWSNHPNRIGHEIIARNLLRWFPLK